MSHDVTDRDRQRNLATNQRGWDQVAAQFFGGTSLPQYGPLTAGEDDLGLLEDLNGKAVLELGCGSGHSLVYLARARGVTELWGVDLSAKQLEFAQALLDQESLIGRLVHAAMDEEAGLPESHFDLVFSIYALGWTPDLDRTLTLVARYLKPGGVFVFSWEHPVYRCLEYDADRSGFAFAEPYHRHGPEYKSAWRGVEIVQYPRTISAYVNAIAQAGLMVERMVEAGPDPGQARPQDHQPDKWYSLPKAELMPTTLVVKARKPI